MVPEEKLRQLDAALLRHLRPGRQMFIFIDFIDPWASISTLEMYPSVVKTSVTVEESAKQSFPSVRSIGQRVRGHWRMAEVIPACGSEF
jgi:hypothetical protein